MRGIVKNLIALLIGTVFAIGACELVLRVVGFESPWFYMPDPHTGMRHRPGAHGVRDREGYSYVRITDDGFRDEGFARSKPAGTFRIAVLGDSYAEAFQVEREETFAYLLGTGLRSCPHLAGGELEVLNFGVSGYGTTQAWLTFRNYAKSYEPDLVLLAFTPSNDVRNNLRRLEPRDMRPYAVLTPAGLEIDDSFRETAQYRRREWLAQGGMRPLANLRTVQALAHIRRELRRNRTIRAATDDAPGGLEVGLNQQVYAEPESADWVEAWRVTEAVVTELQRDVAATGAELILTTVTSGPQVDPDLAVRQRLAERLDVSDLYYPERRIERLAATLGMPFVDLARPLAAEAAANGTYFHGFENTAFGSGHWNADGHRLAGRLLADGICEHLSRRQ